jgi:hypothetical protein
MHTEEHLRVLVWAGLEFRPHLSESHLSWIIPGTITDAEAIDNTNGLERVAFGRPWGYVRRTLDRSSAQAVLEMLAGANAASVGTRYADDDGSMTEGFSTYTYARPRDTGWTDAEVWHAAGSFDYQACEVPDYASTEAAEFIRTLRKRLGERMAGRDAAHAWSIGDESRSLATQTRDAFRSARA